MSVIDRPGQEPERIKKRLDLLFSKLDSAYPDKVIVGLAADHKKWDETVCEIYQILGYDSKTDFFEAYGYTVEYKKPSGRPKTVDPDECIRELKKRYPDGSGFSKIEDLFEANPDLASKKKTLINISNEVFGMPLGKYLKSIGLLKPPLFVEDQTKKNAEVENARTMLEQFLEELKRRLSQKSFIPESVKNLDNSFSDMDFRAANKWVKACIGYKSLDSYLQEQGVLRVPSSEEERMKQYIEVLKERYKNKKTSPDSISVFKTENPDIPIGQLNKYIRNVVGEAKVEKFYIKNEIMQGKPTDLQTYTYCLVHLDYGYDEKDFYYIDDGWNVSIGDFVVIDVCESKYVGEVARKEQYLGIDAPWPVEKTKAILRIATDEERFFGAIRNENHSIQETAETVPPPVIDSPTNIPDMGDLFAKLDQMQKKE